MSSVALKSILFVCVLLCFLQLAAMARIPRSPDGEDPAAGQTQTGGDISTLTNKLLEVINSIKEDEHFKSAMEKFGQAASQTTDQITGVLKDVTNTFNSANGDTATET